MILRAVHREQSVVLILGTHAGLTGMALAYAVFIDGNGKVLWPGLWPFVFFAAWAATAAYHHDRDSRFWWKASFVLLVTAYLSRVAAIAVSLSAGAITLSSDWCLALATWGAFASLVAFSWRRLATPWPT